MIEKETSEYKKFECIIKKLYVKQLKEEISAFSKRHEDIKNSNAPFRIKIDQIQNLINGLYEHGEMKKYEHNDIVVTLINELKNGKDQNPDLSVIEDLLEIIEQLIEFLTMQLNIIEEKLNYSD